MDRLTGLVVKHPMPVLALLAALVIVVMFLLATCFMGTGKKEGIGAGGAQVNDNALLPVGHEGYHVGKLEGIVADGVGDTTLVSAIAVENARELRKQLKCTGRERDQSGLVKDTKEGGGWSSSREGMTATEERLLQAMGGN